MKKEEFYNYIVENFNIDYLSSSLIRNILDYAQDNIKQDFLYNFLSEMLSGLGLTDDEIKKANFK